MEQEPGQDPEDDGPNSSQPPPGSSHPGDTGSPGPGASGSGSPGADADDRWRRPDGDGESVFGPWEALEGTLGAAKEREELLSGFAPGGVWDKHPPGPELAAAVARAAGPDWRCATAIGEEMIGLLRAMASLQSWAGAGLLGMIRALIRDDDQAFLGRSRHGDLPDEWDDSLVHEISLALAVSAPSAGRTTQAAWELGARLPGVELLLRDGTLDLPRARLIAEVFEDLSDENAARAEELLIPRLTEPPRKTYTQVERLATAIAAEVDPDLAERRRKAAEKHRSRVTMFRERSGAAALSGRDLPADQTLAAFAHVNARAGVYKESGAFPEEGMDRLRATAYLDILSDISAEDRIAYGRLSPDDAPSDDVPQVTATPGRRRRRADDGDAPDAPDAGAGLGGSDCPCDECDGRCAPPDDSHFPDDDEPDDDEEPGAGEPAAADRTTARAGRRRPGAAANRAASGPRRSRQTAARAAAAGHPRPAAAGRWTSAGAGVRRRPRNRPARAAIAVPAAPRRACADPDRPGLPARHPPRPGRAARRGTRTRHPRPGPVPRAGRHRRPQPPHHPLRHGHQRRRHRDRPRLRAVRPTRRPARGPAPPLAALPSRANLTITTARLAELRAQPDGRTARTDPDSG